MQRHIASIDIYLMYYLPMYYIMLIVLGKNARHLSIPSIPIGDGDADDSFIPEVSPAICELSGWLATVHFWWMWMDGRPFALASSEHKNGGRGLLGNVATYFDHFPTIRSFINWPAAASTAPTPKYCISYLLYNSQQQKQAKNTVTPIWSKILISVVG